MTQYFNIKFKNDIYLLCIKINDMKNISENM